jgi:hypothetical protein
MTRFAIDLVFDHREVFVTLAYACEDVYEGAEFVGVDSTLIKATRLTTNGERVWMYGDNRPKWLDQFMENNFDEIAERMKQSVCSRPNVKKAIESR